MLVPIIYSIHILFSVLRASKCESYRELIFVFLVLCIISYRVS